MNRVTIDLEALDHNLRTVNRWVRGAGASLTVVTKALCGHHDTIEALQRLGVRSIADSRLENLTAIDRRRYPTEVWYLRPPHRSELAEIVAATDVSLNSELEVIREIGKAAAARNKIHNVVIMIELGDLREGILPGTLVRVYQDVFELPNVRLLGIGANLGCLSGAVPSIDELMQLVLYRELLELKFDRSLPLISAGTSAILPLLLDGQLPAPINHFRIGESILLGTEPVSAEPLRGLRSDVVTLEAEVVEIKEKSLKPGGEVTDMTPFKMTEAEPDLAPGQRGWRALVTLGQVDTEIGDLHPVNPAFRIAGASSDITVVNVGDEPGGLRVGDTIQFRTGYSAFVRIMSNRYTEKLTHPVLGEVPAAGFGDDSHGPLMIPPVAETGQPETFPVLHGTG